MKKNFCGRVFLLRHRAFGVTCVLTVASKRVFIHGKQKHTSFASEKGSSMN